MALDKSFLEKLRAETKRTSPANLIRSTTGSKIKETGNRITGDIRADKDSEGYWRAFTGPECLGDNISLYEKLTGGGFLEAIEYFTGVDLKNENTRSDEEKKEYRKKWVEQQKVKEKERRAKEENEPKKKLRIPREAKNPAEGRKYLLRRGIPLDTIIECEKQGSLIYTEGYTSNFREDENGEKLQIPPGVGFVGRDDNGEIQYINIRYFGGDTLNAAGQRINKQDLPYSNKSYPMTIAPQEKGPYEAYIVEGGINALATYDMCRRLQKNCFVMTTGGVAVGQWTENPKIINILAHAQKVLFLGEFETLKKGQPLPENASEFEKKKNAERILPSDTPETIIEKRQRKQNRIDNLRQGVIDKTREAVSQRRKELYQKAEIVLQKTGRDFRKRYIDPQAKYGEPFNNVVLKASPVPQIREDKRPENWKPFEDISDYWKHVSFNNRYVTRGDLKKAEEYGAVKKNILHFTQKKPKEPSQNTSEMTTKPAQQKTAENKKEAAPSPSF